ERFVGTCYRADNWIRVGETTGRGKLAESHRAVLSRKAVYVHPLCRKFGDALRSEHRPPSTSEVP
ncbi:MAG: DUF4338 domain-containing protein, partial [Proteobacteria bacterium]|nr:DUF4338 domain-containing protein [Pseudomonadota bacterium]